MAQPPNPEQLLPDPEQVDSAIPEQLVSAVPVARFEALREAWRCHFEDPRRERAFLHATGFTVGFAGCRLVTHAIRAQRGPFRNVTLGGRHLHHSTPGIIGQITLGYLWTWQVAVGTDPHRRTASRVAALTAGLATALTLDEFALWFDLADDYWDKQGRKSVDAVVLFWGASAMLLTGRGVVTECGKALRDLEHRRAQ
ncbi:MAG TPA: hypothetical protein VGK33_03485 [Chloroflexota bacterium]